MTGVGRFVENVVDSVVPAGTCDIRISSELFQWSPVESDENARPLIDPAPCSCSRRTIVW